MISQTLF